MSKLKYVLAPLAWRDKITLHTFFQSLLLMFIFTIPLSQQLSIKIIFVTLILSFFVKSKVNFFTRFIYQSWDIMVYMLVLLIGLLYTDNLNIGIGMLETKLSLVAMPLLFAKLTYCSKKDLFRMLFSFCLGLLTSCLICMTYSIWEYINTGDVSVFFFDSLTNIIEFQPTYYAYYLIFGITFLMYLLYYSSTSIPRFLLVMLILFFFFVLLLTEGRTATVSLLFILSFFILKFLTEEKTKIRLIVMILTSVLFVGLFISKLLIDSNRSDQFKGDYWERFVLWEAGLKANPNLFFGVGEGDSPLVLNDYYHRYGWMEFEKRNYNVHNQFIQTYVSNGILGLTILFFLLGRPLYMSVTNKYPLGVLILFPFLVYGITEVFLGRYQGVVFFALLHQIFLLYFRPTNLSSVLKI